MTRRMVTYCNLCNKYIKDREGERYFVLYDPEPMDFHGPCLIDWVHEQMEMIRVRQGV